MTASIVRFATLKQPAAMKCEEFDIGILRQNGQMLLRQGWNTERIGTALNWLRRENASGGHIYIRPNGAHTP